MQIYNLIKVADAMQPAPKSYKEIEEALLSNERFENGYAALTDIADHKDPTGTKLLKYKTNDVFKAGDPIYDSFIVPMFDKIYPADFGTEYFIMPADKTGRRKVIHIPEDTKDPKLIALQNEAYKNYKEDNGDEIRSKYINYIKQLQRNRNAEVLGASVITGGAGAIGSYVGLGLIPQLRKHRLIRAILALASGAGFGTLYNLTANKDIYRNYNWDKLRDAINERKGLAEEITGTPGGRIGKITPKASVDDATKEQNARLSNYIERYGRDIGIGAATGAAAYALTGLTPLKRNKLLRSLVALHAGVGAGWLTDLLTKEK